MTFFSHDLRSEKRRGNAQKLICRIIFLYKHSIISYFQTYRVRISPAVSSTATSAPSPSLGSRAAIGEDWEGGTFLVRKPWLSITDDLYLLCKFYFVPSQLSGPSFPSGISLVRQAPPENPEGPVAISRFGYNQ